MADRKKMNFDVTDKKGAGKRTGWDAKVARLTAAREKLRRQHNAKGQEFRGKKITREEFEQWKTGWFDPRSFAISETLSTLKMQPEAADLDAVDLEQDFAEVS